MSAERPEHTPDQPTPADPPESAADERRDYSSPEVERLGRVEDLTEGAGVLGSDGVLGSG